MDAPLPSADLRDQLQATLSGSYTLERELGGGGMARVFVAEETALGWPSRCRGIVRGASSGTGEIGRHSGGAGAGMWPATWPLARPAGSGSNMPV